MLVSLSTLFHYTRSLIRCNDTILDTQNLVMKYMQNEDVYIYIYKGKGNRFVCNVAAQTLAQNKYK